MARVINSGNQEVNTLGCQWNLILYCNLAQIINLRHIDHVSQKLHRIRPTAIFGIVVMVDMMSCKFGLDY